VVTHHLILSHAAAVKVYREKFQVYALSLLFLRKNEVLVPIL